MTASACLEGVRGVQKVEVAKILGDHDARPSVARLKVYPNPSLAVKTVDAAGPEALSKRLHVGELVRLVQERLEGCGCLPVGALGAGADVCRSQGADLVDQLRGEAP